MKKNPDTKLIADVFGSDAVLGIKAIWPYILDIYPFRSYVRDTWHNKYLTIGADKHSHDMFFILGEDNAIYYKHNFSLFPDLTESFTNRSVLPLPLCVLT